MATVEHANLTGWQHRLAEVGWVTLDLPGGDKEVLALARQLGPPVPSRRGGGLIDCLTPRSAAAAPPRSLSAIHGLGAFPLHTDTAYWPVPARYIVLRSVGARHDRATLLCDTRLLTLPDRLQAQLRRAVWKVSGAGPAFLATLMARHNTATAPCFRFDPGCMTPHNTDAADAQAELAVLLAAAEPVRVDWSPGMTLVVDNWRVLHGRAAAPPSPDQERVLERVTVK